MLIESVVLALFIGLVMGGNLFHLGNLKIRGIYLVLLALALQGIIHWTASKQISLGPQWVNFVLHIISYFLLLGFAFLNLRSPGIGITAIGIFLNGLVIGLNQGKMPVDPTFLPEASRLSLLGQGTHGLLNEGTRLSFLADRFFIAMPGLGKQLFSLGDIFIDIGVFILILTSMTRWEYFENTYYHR